MDHKIDKTSDFEQSWPNYMSVLQTLVFSRCPNTPTNFLAAYDMFFKKTFAALDRDAFRKELFAAWSQYEGRRENKKAAELLRMEIDALIRWFKSEPNVDERNPKSNRSISTSRKPWQCRDATARDMAKAGATTLDSILDALGDLLPQARGLLKVLEEVLDIVAG